MPYRRNDGRQAEQMRPLQAELGTLDRADGSARFGFGSTAALASVSGPIEVRIKEERPDKATLEVVHRPLEGVNATPSKALVNMISSALPPLLHLGQHPRSLIQLVIQSLSPSPTQKVASVSYISNTWPSPIDPPTISHAPMSGMFFGTRAAALNAGSLAMLNTASVAMRAVAVAVSLVCIDGELLVDPTAEEEEKAQSRYVFGWAFGTGISTVGGGVGAGGMDVDGENEGEAEMIWSEAEGEFTKDQYDEALSSGRNAARDILAFFRAQLGEHLSKTLQV